MKSILTFNPHRFGVRNHKYTRPVSRISPEFLDVQSQITLALCGYRRCNELEIDLPQGTNFRHMSWEAIHAPASHSFGPADSEKSIRFSILQEK